MLFKETQNNIKFYSDEKLSFKRKTAIGLLAVAVVIGGIRGCISSNAEEKGMPVRPAILKKLSLFM